MTVTVQVKLTAKVETLTKKKCVIKINFFIGFILLLKVANLLENN